MKIEVGKKYELNNGEVHECTHMRGSDLISVDGFGYGPFVINDILYHQDGRFANADADHEYSVKREVLTVQVGKYYRTRDGRKVGPMAGRCFKWVVGSGSGVDPEWNNDGTCREGFTTYDDELIAEWTEPETGTLAELDVKPGDVVEWFNTSVVNPMEVISASIITSGAFEGQVEAVLSGYGSGIFDVEQFRIISRASDAPKTSSKSWPHNGEWSNWFMSGVDGTIKNSLMRGKECEVETQKLAGCKQVAYRFRIKPEPKRETVTKYYQAGDSVFDTHRITFTTTDGKPDLDSIKMEEV